MQWSLGGFIPGSCVVVWSLLAPVTCIFFGRLTESLRWFAAFVAMVAVSAIAPLSVTGIAPLVPSAIVQSFFVLNVACVSTLIFLAILKYHKNIGKQAEELALLHSQLQDEVDRAQHVQQVLVPHEQPQLENCSVESVYLPAQLVGGDFYQVIPFPDGSVLVAIGDVSGKGIPAAMVVAMVVGALRAASQFTSSPARLLSILNECLSGRMRSGFVTCLLARISASGELAVANAGHLFPYLNGQELMLESQLPLGIDGVPGWREEHRQLAPGDRLTFLSDGVVEARGVTGELFGFERTRAISELPAHSIADAARSFGQDDDITVLTVHFAPSPGALVAA